MILSVIMQTKLIIGHLAPMLFRPLKLLKIYPIYLLISDFSTPPVHIRVLGPVSAMTAIVVPYTPVRRRLVQLL